jgi:hypothetical protein
LTLEETNKFYEKLINFISINDKEFKFLAHRVKQILFNFNYEFIESLKFIIEDREMIIYVNFKNNVLLTFKLMYKDEKSFFIFFAFEHLPNEILDCDGYVANVEYFLNCSMFRKSHLYNSKYNLENLDINLIL